MSANVGGQAVLEGVMMRSPGSWAVAVRRPDGGVTSICVPISSAAARHRVLRLPADPRRHGARRVAGDRFSRARGLGQLRGRGRGARRTTRRSSTELTKGQLAVAFAIAIGFALVVFKVSPVLITSLLPIHDTVLFVVVEGCIRVGAPDRVPGGDLVDPRPAARLPVPRRRAQGHQRASRPGPSSRPRRCRRSRRCTCAAAPHSCCG